ncbi:hypothetical protein [Paenibacillus sp. 1P07SE]|uniref:hypothetical protein n=1 Tax=Paenibacillus sp. 1P07SE TaxID=3132209 RepID=UPI0039A6D10A
MKKDAMKWALLGGVLVFLVLYGIEVVTTGIGTVYGPLDTARTARVSGIVQQPVPPVTDMPPAVREEHPSLPEREQVPAAAAALPERSIPLGGTAGSFDYRPLPPQGAYGITREPSVNRVAEQTAGLLQSLSSNGIRMVVSMFDSLTQ